MRMSLRGDGLKGNSGDRSVRMMDKQEAKLLPCPFCGGEARLRQILNTHVVECGKCWAHSANVAGVNYTKEQAIEAWNRRAT